MSNPIQIQQVPGIGNSIAEALGNLSQGLQAAQEQRRQQQADALKALVAQSQMQEQAAQTQHTQTLTAGERAKQAEDVRKQREDAQDEAEYQAAMGPILLGYTQAGGNLQDPAYQAAVGRAISTVKRPGAGTLLHNRLSQFYSDLTAGPKANADIASAGATAAEAGVKTTTAQATAQLLTDPAQRRLAAMHSAGTLPVYLEAQRFANERALLALKDKNDERSRNAQADLLRRQLVMGAISAGATAFAQDPSSKKPPIETYLNNYMTAYAHQLVDPLTHQPMDPTVIRGMVGQMLRGNLPSPAAAPAPAQGTDTAFARPLQGETAATYWERVRTRFGNDRATRLTRLKFPGSAPAAGH